MLAVSHPQKRPFSFLPSSAALQNRFTFVVVAAAASSGDNRDRDLSLRVVCEAVFMVSHEGSTGAAPARGSVDPAHHHPAAGRRGRTGDIS